MAQTKEGAMKIAAFRAGLTLEQYTGLIETGQKRCTTCKEWKTASNNFGKDQTRADGLDAHCFDCRRVKEHKCWKGRVSTFKGKSHTLKARQKMSHDRKGKPSPKKGQPRTTEERIKISNSLRTSPKVLRGKENPNYRDGLSVVRRGLRFSARYKQWRFDVFARDKFTCQECGDSKGGNLNAHHIKPFAEHPELRFDINNGITLCEACHNKKHFKPGSIRNLRKSRKG